MRAGGSRIVCEPSYVPVENLVFGRLAFKGPCDKLVILVSAEYIPRYCTESGHHSLPDPLSTMCFAGMNAEIEAMMAANKAAMEESQEEADISQEEMASRCVPDIRRITEAMLWKDWCN